MENIDQGAQISVRRIDNGYLMTYYEAVPIECAAGTGPYFRPEPREVYFSNPQMGATCMAKAVEHADRIAQGIESLNKDKAPRTMAPLRKT
jgi:hypothetical protein